MSRTCRECHVPRGQRARRAECNNILAALTVRAPLSFAFPSLSRYYASDSGPCVTPLAGSKAREGQGKGGGSANCKCLSLLWCANVLVEQSLK